MVDDALVAALSVLAPERRLRKLFECALPFSYALPYVAQSPIPPEMLYGREHERDRILRRDQDAAHFVYGGRQLGKTALLHAIRRDHHRPGHFHVLYADLKADGIGTSRPPQDVWPCMAQVGRRATHPRPARRGRRLPRRRRERRRRAAFAIA